MSIATAPDEDFDNAFTSFAVDDAPPAVDPVAADPAPDPVAEGDPAPAVADPAPDPVAEGDPAPAADPVPDLTPAPDGDAILEGLKKLVGSQAPAAPAPAVAETAPTPAAFTTEEQSFLDTYENDWADVSKGEALKRRAEYDQLVTHIFKQVIDFVRPMQETAEILAQRTHLADVTGAIPDYSDQLRDEVSAWSKTQPAYLQPAYDHVIQRGTVDEVKDLVDRYRGATGKAAAGVAPLLTPTPKAPELSTAAKQAAAALAPVESKRSGVQEPGDPSNFDDAWKQFSLDKV